MMGKKRKFNEALHDRYMSAIKEIILGKSTTSKVLRKYGLPSQSIVPMVSKKWLVRLRGKGISGGRGLLKPEQSMSMPSQKEIHDMAVVMHRYVMGVSAKQRAKRRAKKAATAPVADPIEATVQNGSTRSSSNKYAIQKWMDMLSTPGAKFTINEVLTAHKAYRSAINSI